MSPSRTSIAACLDRPASLACGECRRKHLKCDGATPVCARCASTDPSICTYIPSRRGLAGPGRTTGVRSRSALNTGQHARRSARARSVQTSCNTAPASTNGRRTTQQANSDDASPREALAYQADAEPDIRVARPYDAADNPRESTTEPGLPEWLSEGTSSVRIGLYYARFHPLHPMLPPKSQFARQDSSSILAHAVCLIGQYFLNPQNAAGVQDGLALSIRSRIGRGEGNELHRVQAMVLLAHSFLGLGRKCDARECINQASDMFQTFECGPMDNGLAEWTHDLGNLRAEGTRRTFWELYMLDALVALLTRRQPKLETVSSCFLPFTPYQDVLYESGSVPSEHYSQSSFEQRSFTATSTQFSAHYYRAEAVSIVRETLPFLTGEQVGTPERETLSNKIASWKYFLPESGLDIMIPFEADPVMVEAHLLVQTAAIFLHYPHCNLASSAPAALDVTCLGNYFASNETRNTFSIKLVAASRDICETASLACSTQVQSPLVMPAYVLGCAIELAVASQTLGTAMDRMRLHQSRVQLLLGNLKHLGRVWISASEASIRLKNVASALFSEHDESRIPMPPSLSSLNDLEMNGTADAGPGSTSLDFGDPTDPSSMNFLDFFDSLDPSNDLSAFDPVF